MFRNVLLTAILILVPCVAFSFDPCTNCEWPDTVTITGDPTNPRSTDLFTNPDVVHGTIDGDNAAYLQNDKAYVLVGHVVVPAGHRLYIEPGVAIFGTNPSDPNWTIVQDTIVGALIVAQGGRIYAVGSPNCPIIMTTIQDDLCDPYDLDCQDNELWGGVVVCGYADINTTTGIGNIEGIPIEREYGLYGGGETPDDNDTSGVLAYISLRHGGHKIGDANEINGFTFGGVGSGTIVDHLEVFANFDDGYEWFGGNVNGKYLVSSCVGDDSFDHDEGYRGAWQYMFSWYAAGTGDKNGEHDGGTTPESGLPLADPHYYNVTYLNQECGTGSGLHMRDNWAGNYYKSVFSENLYAIHDFENVDAPAQGDPAVEDTELRLYNGDIVFIDNGFYCHDNSPATYIKPDASGYQTALDYFNGVVGIGGPTNTFDAITPYRSFQNTDMGGQGLDPRLDPASPAASGHTGNVDPGDAFWVDDVDYIGAFPPYDESMEMPYPCWLWIAYWTHIYEREIVVQQPQYHPGDADGNGIINILDITYLISFLYKGGPAPTPWVLNGDCNSNAVVNILDVTHMINYLYKGGVSPEGVCCFKHIVYAYQEYKACTQDCFDTHMPGDEQAYLECKVACFWDFIMKIKHYMVFE